MAIDFIAGITTFFILATVALICTYADTCHSHRRRRRSLLRNPKNLADAKIHLHTRL
jgi:hypothetical protein